MATIAPWLQDKLIHDGVLTHDKVTRKPQQRTCPTCRVRVLVAIEHLATTTVTVDATPTTTKGELDALLTGRSTFAVFDRESIERRFDFDITDIDADKAGNIHPEHQCNAPPLPVHPGYSPPRTPGTYPQQIPF